MSDAATTEAIKIARALGVLEPHIYSANRKPRPLLRRLLDALKPDPAPINSVLDNPGYPTLRALEARLRHLEHSNAYDIRPGDVVSYYLGRHPNRALGLVIHRVGDRAWVEQAEPEGRTSHWVPHVSNLRLEHRFNAALKPADAS